MSRLDDLPVENLPLPGVSRRGSKYNFHKLLKMGDSIFYDSLKHDTMNVRTQAAAFARTKGFAVTGRTVEENGKTGVRIWRKELTSLRSSAIPNKEEA